MAEPAAAPWADPGQLTRAEARLLPWLTGDERLLWLWESGRTGSPQKRRARFAVGIALLVIGLIYAVSMLMAGQPRWQGRAAVMAAVAVLGIVILLAEAFGGQTVRTWLTRTWSEAQGGRHPEAGLHGLTQHRVLTLHEGYLAATPLEPGEPVIQYGSLRIDRPNRRGSVIVRTIPLAEQHRLFAALKQARALRETALQPGGQLS